MESDFTVWTPAFPQDFEYSSGTRELVVTFVDGKQTRFFDVDPRLAFLDDMNPRKNHDFFRWVENTKPKFEVITEGTEESGVAQTKSPVVFEQSGRPYDRLHFINGVPAFGPR
jgi:hypothetical protein